MRFVLGLFVLIFASCSNSIDLKDAIGVYVPEGYVNNLDTITLEEEGRYLRKVYDSEGQIVLDMRGKWKFYDDKNNSIQFYSFYLNLDDDLLKYPEVVQDTSGGWTGLIELEGNEIKICVGHYAADLPDQNCYKKLK